MRIARFIVVVVLAATVATPAFAGNPARMGTAGAQELRIPVSARGIALGDGIVADVSGVEALYYNPAGIAAGGGMQVYLSHLEYIADMDKNYVAAVTKTAYGTVGVSVDVLSIGDIEETTEERPDGTGRIFSPNFTAVGLSYARFLTDAVSAGGTVKLISEKILQESATGVAFDVGVQYRPGWKSLRLGFLLKNFGPEMKFEGDDFDSFHSTNDNPSASERSLGTESAKFELPSTFQIAAAYSVYQQGQNRVDGFGNFVNNNFGSDRWQLGAEYSYGTRFAVRAGFLTSEDDDFIYSNSFSFGFGLGIPLSPTRIMQIDYGYRTVDEFFEDSQVFSLTFNL